MTAEENAGPVGIRLYGDSILRTTGKPVTAFGDPLKVLAGDMLVCMRQLDGVGLAATQVGRAIKVAVVDVTGGEKEPIYLVNPVIIAASGELVEEEEGCLSVPTIRLPVKRPECISVKAQDLAGNEYVIEKAEGLFARALQHEIDHLNGILFIDHVSLLQRRLIGGKLRKLAKSGPDED